MPTHLILALLTYGTVRWYPNRITFNIEYVKNVLDIVVYLINDYTVRCKTIRGHINIYMPVNNTPQKISLKG